ncbi:MAG: C10 family peptidase [Prevotella sp.]|nr:C10 family peptidase [Prevotella sp.]
MNKQLLPMAMMLLLTAGQAEAAPRTKAQIQQLALQALNSKAIRLQTPKKNTTLSELKATDTYTVLGYEEGGYAIVSNDDLLPEVLGMSASKFKENNNPNFEWWLTMVDEAAQHVVRNGILHATPKPGELGFEENVGPLLTTKWDQEEPYNNYCPGSGWSKCLTGCVATAMAQVLNYHKMPEHGIGTRTIYYEGQAVTANFGEHYYDWDNMLDIYSYGSYNDAQADAVATLMRDCGVAANMQYGTSAEGGSGAYSQDAAEGLRIYFGLEEAQCMERDYYNDQQWMDMVYKEISENGPIYYGGSDMRPSVWGGHAFVLDGYNAQGLVYVNWGWSGDDDGPYDISLLNPSYYQFDSQQDMIIGLQHEDPVQVVDKEIALAEAGTLAQVVEEQTADENIMIGQLKVSGDINSDDLRYIREQAGCDVLGENTKGRLTVLDLSEARFVEGGDPYLTMGNANLVTSNDILPERAFYGCKKLKTVRLPKGLHAFGRGAFALCSQLAELDFTPADDVDFVMDGNYIWSTDHTELIAILPMQKGDIELPHEVTTIGDYALSGCANISKLHIPASVTTIGREALHGCSSIGEIRVFGKEIPTLAGPGVFDGVSKTNCTLYVRSGMKTKYSKLAQWRDFADNGKDNIVEFGTTIKARNAAREYGQDNPVLGYQIKGDHVTGTPLITCEADRHSPAGRYTIHIEAGSIDNEAVDFEDGYLVVKKATLTATVQNAEREQYQENPEFEISYRGFRNGDKADCLDVPPVVTTEATPESEEGEYVLTLTGGEDDCYEFSFVDGVLTVTESTVPPIPTAISAVAIDELFGTAEVFDLQGRRVNTTNNLPAGIYVVNGRKIVVR